MDDSYGEPSKSRLPQLELAGQQRALHGVLMRKHRMLAQMYLGAIHVLASDNPDRLALAAHCLRELMEKVRRYIPAPLPAKNESAKELPSLGVKVRELEQHWSKAKDKSKCLSSKAWSGTIDSPLANFLRRAQNFFEWHAQERPARKQQTVTVLRQLDPLGRTLPAPIEILRVEEWETYDEFFQGVAHHKTSVSEEDFHRYSDLLENFLLDRLVPRTFEDHKLIDEIIEEGEADA